MISILGFTTGKIRFQVFQNNPVIPTICPYRSEPGQCRRNGGDSGRQSGQIGKITIRIVPPTPNAADDPTVVAVTRGDDGCADGWRFPSARNLIFAR
jgi:hypothetical protein